MANEVTNVRANELPQTVTSGENAVTFSQADNGNVPLAEEQVTTRSTTVEPTLPQQAEESSIRQADSRRRAAMLQFIPLAGQQQAVPAETIETQQRSLEVMPAEEMEVSRESLDRQLTADLEALQAQVGADTEQQRETESLIGNIMTTLGQKGEFSSQLAEQFGVGDLEAQMAQVGSQIRAQAKLGPASLLKAEQDVVGSGVTSAMLGNRLSNRQRDNAIKQLVLGAEQDSIQGRLGAANARIDRAVEAKFAPLEAALDVQKFNLSRLDQAVQRGDVRLSKKEDKQFQSQMGLINKQEKELSETKALQAQILKNQPNSMIRDAILNAGSVEDILRVPGVQKYMISQSERLRNQAARDSINSSLEGSDGLSSKQREKLLKDPNAQRATARIGVIKAINLYRNRVEASQARRERTTPEKIVRAAGVLLPGSPFQVADLAAETTRVNRLTSLEKSELSTMLQQTIAPILSVASEQGAITDDERDDIIRNLGVSRLKRPERVLSAIDGLAASQKIGINNDFQFIDSAIPGATDDFDIFSEFKFDNISDVDFFSEDFSLTDAQLSDIDYWEI